MRSWRMPSFTHQMDSCDNPPAPRLANGVPLSVRILSGKPSSRNACSKIGRTPPHFVERRAVHRSSIRLQASVSERVVGYVSLFGIASRTEAHTAAFRSLVVERFARDPGDAKKTVRVDAPVAEKLPMAIAGLASARLGAEVIPRHRPKAASRSPRGVSLREVVRAAAIHARHVPPMREGSIRCLDDLERLAGTFPLPARDVRAE